MKKIFWLFSIALFLTSCSTTNRFSRTELKTLNKKIENSEVFKKAFTGLAVFDPEKGKYLYEFNSKKHFTPASNIKILTYYVSSKILGDSIPALRYSLRNDSMILYGTGDPTFLNNNFPDSSRVIDFLKKRKEKIFLSTRNFEDDYLGKGWMWDDYPYAFQPQKSSFPIFGNVVEFSIDALDAPLVVHPDYFRKYIQSNPFNEESRARISRNVKSNEFVLNQSAFTGKAYRKKVPFDYSDQLVVSLLSDAIGKPVGSYNVEPMPENTSVFSATVADSLYKQMLHPSDNFVAEQLLLLCSDNWFGTLNTSKIIKAATDSLLTDLPQKMIWADGSGLSRYSKVTPQSLVFVLDDIYKNTSFEKIKHLFPTGGINGTLKNWYAGNTPYIFAKTGTLSGVHNISGYLETNSGKVLIFSFMHNNYTGSSSEFKKEMQTVFEWMRDNY